ncbi:MAG: VanW family protein [Syntrophomonadaceae bacterium]|nr:VanW family protein [Syntrophomonadaceae bacterium]
MQRSRIIRSITHRSLGIYLAILCLSIPLIYLSPIQATAAPGPTDPLYSLAGEALVLSIDSQDCSLSFLAYRDDQGRALLSLSDAQRLLGLNAVLDAGQNLQLERDGHSLVLAPDSYVKFDSWPVLNDSAGRSLRLDIIYLPLTAIADEWDYQLIESNGAISLTSPAYLESQTPNSEASVPGWGSIASVPAMCSIWPDEEIVGGYYTTITNSSANRINNIILSCSSINGCKLAPGEVFSFNGTVGQRTTGKGYKTAPVFSGNQIVSGVGGGICQTSTTLYNAANDSGMQVIERHHHTLPVHYIDAGNDATVSWGTADLKFRNNKTYTVKIMATVHQNYVILAVTRAD